MPSMQCHWLTGVVLLALWVLPARAVDLTKIERTIAKEPAYQGKAKYCLLVFGAEAKTCVWLVLDGDILYVDRNGNGDLTEANKRFTCKDRLSEPVELSVGNGKASYAIKHLAVKRSGDGATNLAALAVDTPGRFAQRLEESLP